MVVEVTFWATIFLGTAGLLFVSVYSLVLFSDLTVDHINPIELCSILNRLIIPEYVGHFYVTSMLILRGYLVTALFNAPLIAFNVKRYLQKRHLLDNTSIFNDVHREKRVYEFKLAIHLLLFFTYLYHFIAKLVDE